MMNLEPLEGLCHKFSLAMETEEVSEYDSFDKSNKHNPQMVSVNLKYVS